SSRGSPMAAAADRNLLLGILAFQNNFVAREQLLAAFKVWVTDTEKALGQVLLEKRIIDDYTRALLDPLVSKHLSVDRNEPAKTMAAVPLSPWLNEQIQS